MMLLLSKHIAKIIAVLVMAIGSTACSEQSSAEPKPPQVSSSGQLDMWQVASAKEPPFDTANTDDAYVVDAFKLHPFSGDTPINLLRTGWEDGWIFYTHEAQNWLRVGEKNVTFTTQFDYGEFTGNSAPDLLLYVNREDNILGVALPDMPRLFEWEDGQFNPVSLSCSSVLKSLFLSKMTFYRNEVLGEDMGENVEAYRDGMVETEAERLKEECE